MLKHSILFLCVLLSDWTPMPLPVISIAGVGDHIHRRITMILITPPSFGVKTLSLSFTKGVLHGGRANVITGIYSSQPTNAKGMPTWMASPQLVLKYCTSRRRPTYARKSTHGLEGEGSQENFMFSINTTTYYAMEPARLLVRGGGGVDSPAGALGAVLFATAVVSAILERRTKVGTVVGAPLLSFGTFCILSNLGLVPASHGLYDLCWTHLLPLSLAVIILGNPAVASKEDTPSNAELLGESSTLLRLRGSAASPMGRVGVSFLIGAVGSVAGVMASFRAATTCGGWACALPPATAAQIAGAVTATYVGGSVNLFAVASAVGLVGTTNAGGASLLGALAAADIFLMSAYFSFLVAVHKTFGSGQSADLMLPPGKNEACKAATGGGRKTARFSGAHTFALLAIGGTICFLGNALARLSPLPGGSTISVTLLTMSATRLLARLAPGFQKNLSRTAPLVATGLLNSFFASVGASGRWADVVSVAPAIFVFASLALAIHIGFMASVAAAANRLCGTRLGVDDLVVASNANIGGPGTAATFAGLIGKDELVVPAAVWGTVGYAIATTLGVSIWAFLR